MKTFAIRAMLAAALTIDAVSGTAFAQSAGGHWAWQSAPQPGPRAPLPAPKRVWIADGRAVVACDCATMKAHAVRCKTMPGRQG